MVTMHFLRLLADLSFYATFAVFIAAHFGATVLWGGVLLCCGCYAVSALFQKRAARLASFAPLLLCGFYRGADLAFLLPCAVYALYLAWQGDYAPDRERQRLLFSVFWKLLLGCAPLALLGRRSAALASALPFALLMLCASVLLLRSLRHEPAVRQRRGYQLMELSLLALTLLAARILGSRELLGAVGSAVKWLYSRFVLPVLELLLRLLVGVLDILFRLFSLLPGRENKAVSSPALDLSGITLFDGMDPGAATPEWLRLLGRLLAPVVAAALLVAFFRWLSRRRSRVSSRPTDAERRESLSHAAVPRTRDSGSVKSIRRQYRHFLKACEKLGAARSQSSTSRDMAQEAERYPELRDLATPIRAIYVPARYGMQADKAAEAEMKRLCAEARKRAER